MTKEQTIYSNYKLLVDDANGNTPVAVEIDGVIAYKLGDKVTVTPDSKGYIGCGLESGGNGMIAKIRRDSTDYFFGIKMDNGQFGYTKSSRIRIRT